MALGRPHLCLGWLFLLGQENRICFNKLIELRDGQIKKETYTSGLPEGYETWPLLKFHKL